MRITFPLLALSAFLLMACTKAPSDAAIRQYIVGTWIPTSAHTVTMHPDGRLKIVHTDATLDGTWTVDGGCLTETITNISGFHFGTSVGHTARYEIVSIDEYGLSYRIPGQKNLQRARRHNVARQLVE